MKRMWLRSVFLLSCLGLVACREERVLPPGPEALVVPAVPSALVSSPAEPANLSLSPVSARSQPVDLVSGMPTRLSPVKRSGPYPLVKSGFAYHKGRPWPQLLLDAAQSGALPTTQRDPLMPVALAQTAMALPSPALLFCATPEIAMPIDAGPRQHWITRQVKSLTGGLWDRWFGDDDRTPAALLPELPAEPLVGVSGQAFLVAERGMKLELKGQLTGQGLIVSSFLQSELQPAVHLLYLERRDCQQAWPSLYQAHRFWFTEEDRTADYRASVAQLDRGRFVSGVKPPAKEAVSKAARLADYRAQLHTQMSVPVWKLMGAGSPERGPQLLSSHFGKVARVSQVNSAVLVLHVAGAVDTRYITEPMLFRMQVGEQGRVNFTRI